MIEIMVVIFIIGVLGSIVGMNVSGSQKRSRNAKLIAETKQVQTGFELYYADHNGYNADCSAMRTAEYFPQGTPTDNVTYACTDSSYCVCVEIEEIGGERKGANSAPGCTFANPKTHFCIINNQ